MPFLRRRQEDEPELSAEAPEPEPQLPPPASEPSLPEAPPAEPAVQSQFQPVEGAEEMLDMPLGTLIFRAGLIAPQQLEDALAEGLRTSKRLGEVLLGRGWLSEEDLSRLLAGQKGLPYADVERVAIDFGLARTMNHEDALREMALPLVIEFGAPIVAMADPDEAAMDRLREQMGPDTRFVVAAPSPLTRLIDEVLGSDQIPAPTLVVAGVEEEPAAEMPVAEEPVAEEPVAEEPVAEMVIDEVPAPFSELVEPEAPVEPEAAAEPELIEPEAPVEPEALPEAEPELIEPEALEESPTEPATVPLVDEGEIEYPTFPDYESISIPEPLVTPGEQLPAEVQTGEYGYYGDSSLLEEGTWQPGETAPAPEQAELEVAETEAIAAEPEPEPAEPEQAQPEPEILQPEASESASEDLSATETGAELPTPAWMRGQVNVITADVADFIASGAHFADDQEASTPSDEPEIFTVEVETQPKAEEQQMEPEEFEQPAPVEPSEPAVAAEADEPSRSDALATDFELVLRLSGGDRIPIGNFLSLEEAQAKAGEVVRQFADAQDGSWPFIAGRFLRPETIVSIDIEEHGSGWSGSGSRGRMFSGGSEEETS